MKWALMGQEEIEKGRSDTQEESEGGWVRARGIGGWRRDVPTRRSGRCQSAESAPDNVLAASAPPWRGHCGLR